MSFQLANCRDSKSRTRESRQAFLSVGARGILNTRKLKLMSEAAAGLACIVEQVMEEETRQGRRGLQ